jgi:hypothetical protein
MLNILEKRRLTTSNQNSTWGLASFFVFFSLFAPFGEFFQGVFYLLVDEVAYAQEEQVHLFYRVLQFLLNVFPHFHILVFFAQRFESPPRRVSK